MAPLVDTRAIIIDVRRNGGGATESEVYLASYFLDPTKPVIVSRLIWRNPDTETFRTEDFPNTATPFFYKDKPVYVLTSQNTFSGGATCPCHPCHRPASHAYAPPHPPAPA
jgi:C-terminal processing protease CtpA/Prc